MNYNEQNILEKLFWPKDKCDLTGNIFYSNTDEKFTTTKTIGLSRSDAALEVFYCEAPNFTPDEKQYFVKLIFEREGENITLNHKKSSPEIKTDQDIESVLNSVQNSIILMNTTPQLFMTGVLKKEIKNTFKK